MRGSYTPAVQRALSAARSWASAAGRHRVAPEDWLAGLLVEEAGRAAELLSAAGLDVLAYRTSLALPVPEPEPKELDLERTTQAGLYAAAELSLDLEGERTVSGPALALGLLAECETLRDHLATFGLDYAKLLAHAEASKLPPIQMEEPLQLAPMGEEVDIARILDASANRAREALRVIEDHCRFVLDDAHLSRRCKELRHELQRLLALLPYEHLLKGRDTQRDVGTEISTPSEQKRGSLEEVLRANLKRLQESARSLEEFAKIGHPEVAGGLEKLRYESYTLEKAFLLSGKALSRLRQVRLYGLLTAAACRLSVRDTLIGWAEGGVEMVQLREKDLDDRTLLARAREVRTWTRELGLLLIVNDRADIARLVEADGVHLGQEDLPVKEARRLLGSEALIGVSTHNLAQVRAAVLDGADYLGVGPVFPSETKAFNEQGGERPGLAFVREALAETSLPAFAIGGINLGTIVEAVAAGVNRAAVSQALTATDAPGAVARALRQYFR